MKLALGTVQFGLNYGIANKTGQVNSVDAAKIVQLARDSRIDTVDTAIVYGNSEKVLGEIGLNDLRIVTKLPEVPVAEIDPRSWIIKQFNKSLERLKVDHVTGLMLHRPIQLMDKNGIEIWEGLQSLKNNGLVSKIGYSIYSPNELNPLWEQFRPDIIQAPYNVFDQRLRKSGWLDRCHSAGVEVHARSVFLQGLLLMSADKRPSKFDRWNNVWNAWDDWLESEKLDPLDACLRFVVADEMIDRIVVGIDNVDQLTEIVTVLNNGAELQVPNIFSIEDESLLNPALW